MKAKKNKKQPTAVEWLIEKLYSHQKCDDILNVANLLGYFGEAKQMEKKQIKGTLKIKKNF